MCELIFKRMGIGVVYMSGGELESPDAGDPARLIRLRYREAGEWSKVNGRMAVLMINDFDAGAGRFNHTTQYTVNTQLVNATLMNIADNPTNVQLPGSYDSEPTRRIPIILTGNDFSTLYSPLVRDGRMEKFYWEPDRADRLGIVSGIFEVDDVSRSQVEELVNIFPEQSIDFFGALRSRLYDEQVRQLIHDVGVDKISSRVVNSDRALPEFQRPDFSLPHLIEVGQQIMAEQEQVQALKLVEVYNQSPSGYSASQSQKNRSNEAANTFNTASSDLKTTGRNRRYSTDDSYSTPGRTTQVMDKPQGSNNGNGKSAHLPQDLLKPISDILDYGNRVGIEYVDARRFRTNSWQSYATIQANEQDAIAALQACLAEHPKDYIRLVNIDPNSRKRLSEQIIQRP